MKKILSSLLVIASAIVPISIGASCGKKIVTTSHNKASAVDNEKDDLQRMQDEIAMINSKIHATALVHQEPIVSPEIQSLNATEIKKEMLTIPQKDGIKSTIIALQPQGTNLSVDVQVSSDVAGTKAETYTVLLKGFNPLTSDEATKQLAQAKVEQQKLAAQALIDKVANEKTIKLELTTEAKLLTAVKLRQTSFIEKQVTEGDVTVSIAATNIIRLASQPNDGSVAIVQLKVASAIQGTVPKFYEVQISGLVPQARFAETHNFVISSSSYNPIKLEDIKLDPAIGDGARGGVARYGASMMESFILSMSELMGYQFHNTNLSAQDSKSVALKAAIAAIKDVPNYGPLNMAKADIYPDGMDSIRMWGGNGRLDVIGKSLEAWNDRAEKTFTFNGVKFEVNSYSTWIDGTNPGHMKAWVHFASPDASTTLESTEAIVPHFHILEGQKWEDLKNSLLAAFKNLGKQFGHNTTLKVLKSYISPQFVDMLQYASDNYNIYSDDELIAMFNKLNNGSFDMYALDYATKGVINMPTYTFPRLPTLVSFLVPKTRTALSGFASFTTPYQLAPWFYRWDINNTTMVNDRITHGYSVQGNIKEDAFIWTAPKVS